MFEADVLDVPQRALTGDLPAEPRVAALLREAHERYADEEGEVVADYICALAEADPRHFGLSLTEVDGTVLGVGVGRAVVEAPEMPEELVSQVDLDQVNFVSNDELHEVLSRTTATEEQVDAAVALNEEQRLRTLKIGFLILAGLSAVAALPASRLPTYLPEEIPDPDPVPVE